MRRNGVRRSRWRSPQNLLRARINSSAGLRALSARRKPSPIVAVIDAVLASNRQPEPAAIERLTHHRAIADAVRILHRIVRQPNEQGYSFAALIFERHVPPELRLRRFAVFFRLIRAQADRDD